MGSLHEWGEHSPGCSVFGAALGLWTGPSFSRSLSFPICAPGRECTCLVSIGPFKLRNNKAMRTVMTMPVCIECLLCARRGSVSPRILTLFIHFSLHPSGHCYPLVVLMTGFWRVHPCSPHLPPPSFRLPFSLFLEQTRNYSPWASTWLFPGLDTLPQAFT